MKIIWTISRMVEIISFLLFSMIFVGMLTGDATMLVAFLYLFGSINGMIWGHFFGNLMELKIRKMRKRRRIVAEVSPFDLDLIEYRRVV